MWVVYKGLAPEAGRESLGLPREGQVWRWCSCLGHRGSGSTGTQGGWRLGQQGIQCSRRVWQPLLANTLQYSCLENPLSDRKDWQAIVYRVPKCQIGPKRLCMHRHKTFFSFACGGPAPVRVEHEGGAAAWLAGTQVMPSVQGHRLPLLQELWPCQHLFSSFL